jgi:hypothetical protein
MRHWVLLHLCRKGRACVYTAGIDTIPISALHSIDVVMILL